MSFLRSASPSPATSDASGPTNTRSAPTAGGNAAIPSTWLVSRSGTHVATSSMPAFPGAHQRPSTRGLFARDVQIACSRPPPPTTTTFTADLRGRRPCTTRGARADERLRPNGLRGQGSDLALLHLPRRRARQRGHEEEPARHLEARQAGPRVRLEGREVGRRAVV